jgi:hypothetical protein
MFIGVLLEIFMIRLVDHGAPAEIKDKFLKSKLSRMWSGGFDHRRDVRLALAPAGRACDFQRPASPGTFPTPLDLRVADYRT